MEDKELKKMVSSIENDVFYEYLRYFDEYTPIQSGGFDIDKEWKENRIRNIRITKLLRSNEDSDIDNLCQLFQAFSNEECTIGILFKHDLNGTEVYLRVADIRKDVSSSGTINVLSDRTNRILASTYSYVDSEEVSSKEDVLRKSNYIVSVTNLASEKNDNLVSIENLLSYNDKEKYSVLLLAEPITDQSLFKTKIAKLCSHLSEISKYESEQLTTNTAYAENKNLGFALFLSAGMGKSETKGEAVAKTNSNYSVKHMIERISKNLDRIELCKALGGWHYSTYVISDSSDTAKNIAYQYDAIVKGKESNNVSSAIICWGTEESKIMFDYLLTNRHPIFANKKDPADKKTLSIIISSIELAHAMNFPRKSVPGFSVGECASFGRNITFLDGGNDDPKLDTGALWHMRHDDGKRVEIDKNLLTSHTFVSGSTGSGKSNAVYQLLNSLQKQTFLVVEPTKGEYKQVFGGCKDVTVYGTNPQKSKLLKINPFSFPEGIQIYAHIDRLIEIFNACWPMYAAMPAILKDAIERAYISAGWDLKLSRNVHGIRIFPSFVDVLNQIDVVLNESDYSGDSKGDYKGALKTRLKSLSNGIYSLIFGCDEISDSDLFDKKVIVDLSEIGSETTSLVMGILIFKLHEYRSVTSKMNSKLKHITVLEEAHNLLKRTSTEQAIEGSNLVGKSVEMITNAIAEMRTYGEGFIIVDQAPGALDPAVIRNTNTKIVLRMPDYSDRELVGKSIGLNEEQIIELSRLERGVAAVYQSGWAEPVLCKFGEFKDTEKKPLDFHQSEILCDNTASILLGAVLYGGVCAELRNAIYSLRNRIVHCNLPVEVKQCVYNLCISEKEITEADIGEIAYNLIGADKLYETEKGMSENMLTKQIAVIRRKYQITGRTMEKDSLSWLMSLIESEHQRRLEEWMYSPMKGVIM